LVNDQKDVTVIGAGLAGMAAAIHLARAGLRVLCIDAEAAINDPVGESLDWSAPALLQVLGLPMEQLIEQGIATWKRHVVLKVRGGGEQHYTPGEWLGKPPYNVDLRTMHVDRTKLNQAIREICLASGVTLVRDRVVDVETAGKRVVAIVTAGGQRIASAWFMDASGGGASLFPRLFGSPSRQFGPQKVAIWDYFAVEKSMEGTTLHADGAGPPYMEWVWQIPIHPHTISVGYVSPANSVKEQRRKGRSVREIFDGQLEAFADLRSLGAGNSPRTTSFRCRLFERITGPNWLVMGEAAAMVDPMTSNGVTAALRHAAEGAALIARYRHRKTLPWLPAALYRWRVLSLAGFFNYGIEKVLYDWPIRNRIGPLRAGDVYTIPAWSINVIYSRLRPRGLVTTAAFTMLLASLRCALGVFYWFCKRSSAVKGAGCLAVSS
jgi:flavin-dependent dehydrogenase